jgi:hypothetical protein
MEQETTNNKQEMGTTTIVSDRGRGNSAQEMSLMSLDVS